MHGPLDVKNKVLNFFPQYIPSHIFPLYCTHWSVLNPPLISPVLQALAVRHTLK